MTQAESNLICWQLALEKKVGQCKFESEAWDFYADWWGGICGNLDQLRDSSERK